MLESRLSPQEVKCGSVKRDEKNNDLAVIAVVKEEAVDEPLYILPDEAASEPEQQEEGEAGLEQQEEDAAEPEPPDR
jgi:hypothetical protein